MPTLYLAGPTVFAPDAAARFDRLRSLCSAAGARGVAPTDGEPPGHALPGPLRAARLFERNVALIRAADGMIADASPFRGLEPDSGTMWEIGFAWALGKPVAVYGVPPGTHEARIVAACGARALPDPARLDASGADAAPMLRVDGRHGAVIEAFDLPLNLMIACSAPVVDGPEAAIASVLARLAAGASARPGA